MPERQIYLNDMLPWTDIDERDLMSAIDKFRALDETAIMMQRGPAILVQAAKERHRRFER
jgi:hypothetical protein